MNGKLFLFIAIPISCVIAAGVIMFLSSLKPTFTIPFNVPTPTPFSPNGGRQPSTTPFEKTVIDDVQINDVLTSPIDRDPADQPIFIKNTEYNERYISDQDSFSIIITGSPFDTVRKSAEEDFIKRLGISQSDACQLHVSIATPQWANPDFAGQTFGLSFCEANYPTDRNEVVQ